MEGSGNASREDTSRPTPAFIPEPTEIRHRTVSVEGYVSIEIHQYSVPPEWIGRWVRIVETQVTIEIQLEELSSKTLVFHQRVIDPKGGKTTLPEHRIRGQGRKRKQSGREEKILQEIAPELAPYIELLKAKGKKQTTLALRQLIPKEPYKPPSSVAHHYGL